jgi:hypothetical protein
MTKSVKKMNHRKSGYLFQVLFLTVSTFFVNPANAQEMMVVKLSDSELSAVLPILKADALARKNNIIIYNKFKAELDPILDILQQYMY